MKKGKAVVFLVLAVVILAGIAGIFYYKSKIGGEVVNKPTPPRLFSKGDYVVEDRTDGKYIVVNKVGLTAKVPPTWRVEFESNAPPNEEEYFVKLYSPNATGTDYLKNGCEIGIIVGDEEENNQNIRKEIQQVKDGVINCENNFPGTVCEVSSMGVREVLKWASKDLGAIGQFLGVRVPIGEKDIIGISTSFSVASKDQCALDWQNFLKNIMIIPKSS
ncbi:MAG: hypothetical protein V1819_00630 [bacterium]